MKDSKRVYLLVFLAFAALVVVAYAWSAGGQFLNWDDPKYVRNNPELQRGGISGITSLFTTLHFANYNPLHRLSYLIEWRIFGDNATAYRITNIVLHLANALLLFALLRIWCQKLWIAAGAAALFLIHPVGVETVAWISERKSVMATGFAFGSVLCWLRAGEGMRHGRAVAWVLFTLGMLCKTSIVVLPVLLAVLDWSQRRSLRDQWKWYAAFMVPAIALGIVQIVAAASTDSIVPLHGGGIVSHCATIIAVVPFYFRDLVFPFGLTPRHEFAPAGLGDPRFWLGAVTLGVLAWGVVRSARGERRFAAAIAWCFAALLVTLIVPIPIVLADRYWYFAMPLLLAVFVESAMNVPAAKPQHARIAVAGLAVVLSIATLGYANAWRDSTALWTHALMQHPTDVQAWISLGAARAEAGDPAAAQRAYGQAVELAPDYPEAIESLANVEMQMGKLAPAQRRLGELLEREPDRGKARAMFAVTFDLQGEAGRADAEFRKALASAPTDTGLVMNYVNFCGRHQRPHLARKALEAFVSKNPGNQTAKRALQGLASPPR